MLAVGPSRDAAPVLYVPPRGAVPAAVRAAYRERRPEVVEVVAAAGQLPDAQVRAVIGAARFMRIAPNDPVRLRWRQTLEDSVGSSDGAWTRLPALVFASVAVPAEAAAAAQLRARHLVLLPPTGGLEAPAGVRLPPAILGPSPLVVGAVPSLTSPRRAAVLPGIHFPQSVPTHALAGTDRYETAALVAQQEFGDGARTAYLVSGLSAADAALTATLSDRPVYLVAPCGPLPEAVAAGLRRVRPQRVVAVGDDRALCPRILQDAVASTTVRPVDAARDVVIADRQVCLLTRAGYVRCFGESSSGQVVRAPQPVAGLDRPVRSIVAGDQEVCAIDLAGAVWCWGGSSVSGPAVRVAGLSGVEDYAPGQRVSCGLLGTGRLWCRSGDGGFREMRGLPSATRFVYGAHVSCLQEAGGAVWCWRFAEESGPPAVEGLRRTPVASIVQIASSGWAGVSLRAGDGTLWSVSEGASGSISVARGERVRSLYRGAPGCFLPVDGGQLVCQNYESAPLLVATGPAPLAVATAGDGKSSMISCAARADGSVACRVGHEDGSWAVLGDGALGPRYREVEVLGFGRS